MKSYTKFFVLTFLVSMAVIFTCEAKRHRHRVKHGNIGGYHAIFSPGFPIARDTFNKFEDSLVVTGQIEKISGLYPQCGVLCSSELFVFRLTEKCKNYNHPYVYVGFTCFETIKEYELHCKLQLQLKKIALNDNGCFWRGSVEFDSGGLPFYELVGHSEVK